VPAHRVDTQRTSVQAAGQRRGRQRLLGQLLQGVEVGLQLFGGARQRLGDAAGQHVLQQRQHLLPEPDAAEPGVAVVRVLPGRQPQRPAGRLGIGAPQRQQRAQVTVLLSPHAGDRARPRPASQPEQHGLGLIVGGVAEQHQALVEERPQRRVAGGPGSTLRAAGRADVDPQHLDRVQPELVAQDADPFGLGGRAVLQAVIDADQARRPAGAGAVEGQGRRQRERVGTAGTGHEGGGAHWMVGQRPAHRQPDGGHRRMRAHR
jgi:hypothetical protein